MKQTDYTEEELEQMLADRKKAKAKATEKEKNKYEAHRDKTVRTLIELAKELFDKLDNFKNYTDSEMSEQKKRLDEYGLIRRNSKGGYTLKNSDDTMKITRHRATNPKWDERGEKGVELIGEFLKSTVKKRSIKIYEILISFLERNKKGDLEYSKAMGLLQHRDKYDDPNWLEGLRLIQESYSLNFKKYSYSFEEKDKEGKWQRIDLNFTAL